MTANDPSVTDGERVLFGLLELVQEEFDTVAGYVNPRGAGETLVLQFPESASEEHLNDVETFLDEYGARTSRTNGTNDNQFLEGGTTTDLLVVLDDYDVSWNETEDTRVNFSVELVIGEPREDDNVIADVELYNDNLRRIENGSIEVPDSDSIGPLRNSHVKRITTNTVETLTEQPVGVKSPPTVTVIEHDETGEPIDELEFNDYDSITTEADGDICISKGNSEIRVENAAINKIWR